VTIQTRRGQTLIEDVRHRTMTPEELQKKFDALVIPRFGRAKTGEVTRLLLSLETAAGVKPLMTALANA